VTPVPRSVAQAPAGDAFISQQAPAQLNAALGCEGACRRLLRNERNSTHRLQGASRRLRN